MNNLDYPKISIIIINWEGYMDTIECLESLYQITYPNYDVIVIDNGSENNSIEQIKRYCKGNIEIKSEFFKYTADNKPITIFEYTNEDLGNLDNKKNDTDKIPPNKSLILIKNDENYGFAEGNNIGIRYVLNNLKPEHILLLNNDTVVDKSFLSNLIDCYDNKLNIAAIQSAIYYYDNKDKIQSIGGKFNLFTGSGPSITNTEGNFIECDTVNGAAMLIKSSALEKVGLIDNQYFLYMEETDWCIKAKKKGFILGGCKKSKVWHKIYSSSGGDMNPVLLYYWNRNILLFYKKYCKKYFLTFFPFYIIRLFIQLGKFSLQCDFKKVKAIFYGFFDGIFGKTGRNYREL